MGDCRNTTLTVSRYQGRSGQIICMVNPKESTVDPEVGRSTIPSCLVQLSCTFWLCLKYSLSMPLDDWPWPSEPRRNVPIFMHFKRSFWFLAYAFFRSIKVSSTWAFRSLWCTLNQYTYIKHIERKGFTCALWTIRASIMIQRLRYRWIQILVLNKIISTLLLCLLSLKQD